MLGIIFGTLVVSRVGHWLVGVVASISRLRKREDSQVSNPSVWTLMAPIALHSGPWLLAATLSLAHFVLSNPHTSGWSWFFGGVAAAPMLWAPLVWSLRRPRSTSPTAASSELHDRAFFKFARWLGIERNYVVFTTLTAGLVGSVILTALFFDQVKRAPALFIVVLAGSIVFALMMSKIIWSITHPKPWRIPPSKHP